MRTALARAVAAALLPLAAFPVVAAAEPIPADLLAADRRACIAACTAQGVAVARCKPYCDCTFQQVAQQFTLEEYNEGRASQQAGQPPPAALVTRMSAISKSCAAATQ